MDFLTLIVIVVPLTYPSHFYKVDPHVLQLVLQIIINIILPIVSLAMPAAQFAQGMLLIVQLV
jgi:hypothetical protein